MYELQVEGMTCGGCVRSVTKLVQAIDAGAKVEVDLKSKMVRIDTVGNLQAITAAIANAGYPVTASTAI